MLIPLNEKLPKEQENAEFLGGKGFGLYWMLQHGVPVPPAMVIPTTVCVEYMTKPKTVMTAIKKQLPKVTKYFTEAMGYRPLLSVRSGARVSMPGMMDTILNVGIDQFTEESFRKMLGDQCFEDCKKRLIEMYTSVVGDRKPIPMADDQLLNSIEAVFKSWNNERAQVYRKLHKIPEEWGTAVVIQAMVFGNLNDESGTGVLFTRNPDTGEDKITGEFLINAQGEDVVAGIRTPMPLSKMAGWNLDVSDQLIEVVENLEFLRKDVQDVEFTVQDSKLWILQTRNAKRSSKAAVRIAVEMFEEGLIDRRTALKRVTPRDLDLAQAKVVDPSCKLEPNFVGIPACSGVAKGIAVFDSQAAIDCKEPCVLVTKETTPDDIAGMVAAKGVITMNGGATSHAAVVARGMNKPCVVGLGDHMNAFAGNTMVTIDGATGRVWFMDIPVVDGSKCPVLGKFRKMMIEEFGIIPLVNEPLPGVPEVLLDATAYTMNPDGLRKKIMDLLEVHERVYVDTRLNATDADKAFFGMISGDTDTLEQALYEAVVAKLPKGARPLVVWLTRADVDAKDRKIGGSASLEDMVMATDGIVVTEKMTEAQKKVLEWKAKEGIPVVSVGKFTPGSKSLVSTEEMLQLLS